MLIVRDLGIEIGARRILEPVSFTVGNGEKVGLVGRNGAGKSTLLSVLLGQTPEHLRISGTVQHQGRVSHLPQEPVSGGLGVEPIGLSHVLSARGLDQLDADMQHARHELAADPSDGTIERFTALEEMFRERGGYEAESEVARLAAGLGLAEDLLLEDLDSLSGGQRRRVDLMRVLYEQPETMVLDEPTNHLDKAAKRWLFDELERYRGTVLVISHDLPLLDKSIDRVLALREGQLREYKGNYTKYLEQEETRRLGEEKLASHQDEQINRMKTLADSMRGQTESRARLAKVLDRKVEKLVDNRVVVTKKERKVTFKLPSPPRSGDVPMTVEHVGVRYGSLDVLSDVNFITRRGDRILIVGKNGAGKSSLLERSVRKPALSNLARTSLLATSPRSTNSLTSLDQSLITWRMRQSRLRYNVAHSSVHSVLRAPLLTKHRERCRVANAPSWPWRYLPRLMRISCCWMSRRTTSTPQALRRWAS